MPTMDSLMLFRSPRVRRGEEKNYTQSTPDFMALCIFIFLLQMTNRKS